MRLSLGLAAGSMAGPEVLWRWKGAEGVAGVNPWAVLALSSLRRASAAARVLARSSGGSLDGEPVQQKKACKIYVGKIRGELAVKGGQCGGNFVKNFLLLAMLKACVPLVTVGRPPAPSLYLVRRYQLRKQGQGSGDAGPKGVAGDGILSCLAYILQHGRFCSKGISRPLPGSSCGRET
jgi:hypothetical protein